MNTNWVDDILRETKAPEKDPVSAMRLKSLAELRKKYPQMGIVYPDASHAKNALLDDGYEALGEMVFAKGNTHAYIHHERKAVYLGHGSGVAKVPAFYRSVSTSATIHFYEGAYEIGGEK